MRVFLIILSVLVGAFRPVLLFKEFNPHIQSSYEAVAHILVGALLCAWLTSTDLGYEVLAREYKLTYQDSKVILFTLTAIEVICALVAFYT